MYSVSDIISSSLKLAWKHKILWILALMIGAGGFGNGGGGGGSSSDDYSSTDTDYYNEYNYPQENSPMENMKRELNYNGEKLVGMVLGESDFRAQLLQDSVPEESRMPYIPAEDKVVQDPAVFQEQLLDPGDTYYPYANTPNAPAPTNGFIAPEIDWLGIIGMGNIILVSVSFIIFMLFTIGTGIFSQSWAVGAFLGGIDDAITEKDYTLRDLGNYGRRSTKEFVKYKLLYFVLVMSIMLIGVGAGAFALVSEQYAFLGLAFLLLVPVTLVFVLLAISNTLAIRFIALRGVRYIDAIKSGLKMLMSNVVKYFVLSIANCFVAGAIGLLVIGAFIAAIAGLIIPGTLIDFENVNPGLLVGLVTLLIPVFFILLGLMMTVGAYLTTYKNFTWSMFFNFGADNVDTKYKIPEASPPVINQKPVDHPSDINLISNNGTN